MDRARVGSVLSQSESDLHSYFGERSRTKKLPNYENKPYPLTQLNEAALLITVPDTQHQASSPHSTRRTLGMQVKQ
jgi:hypothetical protein